MLANSGRALRGAERSHALQAVSLRELPGDEVLALEELAQEGHVVDGETSCRRTRGGAGGPGILKICDAFCAGRTALRGLRRTRGRAESMHRDFSSPPATQSWRARPPAGPAGPLSPPPWCTACAAPVKPIRPMLARRIEYPESVSLQRKRARFVPRRHALSSFLHRTQQHPGERRSGQM